jgi:hypothetical protein
LVTTTNSGKENGVGTCKDCTHWDCGKCTFIYWSDLDDEEEAYDGFLIYVDCGDPQAEMSAVLKTGPDFGCVHFRQRAKGEGL